VAELSGSSVAGVKMRLHRARRALRAQLKEDVGV
jgi:DNA-directed RNA polymerase specialized sigma24 family protein